MKYFISFVLCILLTACAQTPQESAMLSDVETTSLAETTVTVGSETVIDTAFGKPCTYVSGDTQYPELACSKGDVQTEWKTPADGWQLTEVGDKKYIHQVYADGILLLPMDYGSNIYTVIGLDGELPEECAECP